MKSKRRLNPGELMHAFIRGGVPAVSLLADEVDIDARQVKRAIQSLEKRGHVTTNIEAWLSNTYGVEYRKSSRRTAQVGDVRYYKATPHGGSNKEAAYAKVPLSTLGIHVGASFKVEFREGETVITKA